MSWRTALPRFGTAAIPTVCALACLAPMLPARAQMVTGSRMPGFAQTFGVVLDAKRYPYHADLVRSSVPANILWPGEQPTFTLQLANNDDKPLRAAGKVLVIEYATKGRPGDVWVPDVYKVADVGAVPIDVSLAAKGYADFTVRPRIPARNAAYALVVDLGPAYGRQFLTSCVRTFRAIDGRVQYPKFCLDDFSPVALRRLGVKAVRHGIGYKPTTDADFGKWLDEEGAKLRELYDNNISVLFMAGAGGWYDDTQPMKWPRPWLDETGTMMDTKTDLAWLPSYDPDFRKWCNIIASRWGWPKGPINAFSLWNEPWEGISISGWGADMTRYREIYTAMCAGVDAARKQSGVSILLGGCDSSSNAMDKLFGDGSDKFLPWFDFLSVHYQGLDPHSTVKAWVDRKSPRGRVKIWDTESWVANVDDRVAAVIAANRAAGYDRAMGIYGGNIFEEHEAEIRGADGKTQRVRTPIAWSVAASVGAAQHFLGERDFRSILFKNGLPWVMVFDGLAGPNGKPNAEDGTVVVVGDLGEEFGPDGLLFRTARGSAELEHKAEIRRRLSALPADAPAEKRAALQTALDTDETLSGATMSLPASSRYALYDFYGNLVPARSGRIVVPLDGRGFFLRGSGQPGAFAALLTALRASRIDGIEPLAPQAHDMMAPIGQKPTMRLTLTNVLNRSIQGRLTLKLGSLRTQFPARLAFGPNETKQVTVKVVGGRATLNNTYHLSLVYDAGKDGHAVLEEDMHCNIIAHRTVKVDGSLDDWTGVLPQTISVSGKGGPTMTELAWQPFKAFDQSVKQGFATGYLAYDDASFYFAARIADSTPDPGMVRFETRDDDAYFYPKTSYRVDPAATLEKKDTTWWESTKVAWALQKPTGDERAAGAWESTSKAFAIDLELPPDRVHQVAFYFTDNDDDSRGNETITLMDPATNKVLDERRIERYRLGKYLVYNLSGAVRVKLTTDTWLPASLNAIFFDSSRSGGPAAGASAAFVREDNDTQGNWRGAYGADGYNVIGVAEKYPAYASVTAPKVVSKIPMEWPDGVRRYSYRKDPDLPAGNAPNHDNVQIAFNVLPAAQKDWYVCPPGTMPGFINYRDTDYEYALNPVADQYGGGTEIWRMEVPGMPHKQFYPRQPRSPFDGPVKGGKLAVRREGNTRIVECAIPWSEIPAVKKRLDAGQPIKFSFRVNDNAGGPCMELSRKRSVAKRNGSFHVDWAEHWANELEFAFER